jgi:L-seryl-tRNA(Ser) seleniumtransferase
VVALDVDVAALRTRADRLAAAIGAPAYAVESQAAVGGGGAPGVMLPSAAVALPPALAGRLRLGDTPVVGRVHDDRLLLDLLTVPEEHDDLVVAAVRRALEG